MSEPSIEDYTIGWICALQEEYEAACRMLDDEFEGPEAGEVNDNNTYVFGRIGGHNVVIGCLPDGRYGTSSAATVAKDMVRSFVSLRFALMVGIGGGAPTRERDIRLGDVVVSIPQGQLGGVVQYDFGKRLSNKFERTGQLNAPPAALLGVIPEIRRRHNDPRKPDRVAEHLKLMDDMPSYQRPAQDRLYRADHEHQGGQNCENCGADGLEKRPKRESSREVTVHYGTIASANTVMKNARDRDQYAKDPELKVLCFEMEAGGLMNNFPCLVIRGVCDYSDSHKNDEWHSYAALTAAAYARELLIILKPRKVSMEPPWAGKMENLLAGIQEKADDIIRYQHHQEHQAILDWLTPIDYSPQQHDYISRRQSETGQWLLDTSEFQDWLRGDSRTLFCPGMPGAGKTILTSIVVHDLNTRFRNDMTIGIAYLYCNFARKDEQSLENLVLILLKQLAQGHSCLPNAVKDLHNHYQRGPARPSFDEISKTLQSVAALYSRVFILIDALDECQTSEGCRTKLLSEIFSLQVKCAANLFATSRFVAEITERFEGRTSLEIKASDEDVRVYLDSHMPNLPSFVSCSPGLQKAIKDDIVMAVDGMCVV